MATISAPKDKNKTTKSSRPAPAKPARGLGRGLAALIPESDFDILSGVARGDAPPAPLPHFAARDSQKSSAENSQNKGAPGEAAASASDVRYLDVSLIEPNPYQPRQVWSETELEDLGNSIREHGVLQPILIRPLAGSSPEKFQLIAGERRWRAAQRAGLSQIPAIIRAVDDRSALELAIIENVQRHDISAVESAHAYRRLSREFGLSQEQVAARVGKSRVSVANTMRLLDLPIEALEALQEGKISEGHGRALLTAQGESARRILLRRILRDGLTVRDVERMAREGVTEDGETLRLGRTPDANLANLENKLGRSLGLRIKLKPRARGGQLVIDYASPEELQRIARKLGAPEAEIS